MLKQWRFWVDSAMSPFLLDSVMPIYDQKQKPVMAIGINRGKHGMDLFCGSITHVNDPFLNPLNTPLI